MGAAVGMRIHVSTVSFRTKKPGDYKIPLFVLLSRHNVRPDTMNESVKKLQDTDQAIKHNKESRLGLNRVI